MPPKSISESPRTYRSELRQQQAQATRTRVLEAAAELFAADGYARTTLAKIAKTAGVSAETVQGQGPKAALLIAAVEHLAVGRAGEENILNLDFARTLLALDDRDEAMDFLADYQTGVHERTAALALAIIGGAGADSELQRYWHDLTRGVTLQVSRVVAALRDKGWVRDDIPFEEVAETTAALCSVEVFVRVTRHDGWSVDAYRRWCRRMLAETVFER